MTHNCLVWCALSAVFVIGAMPPPAAAQQPPPDVSAANRLAIDKTAFMVGEWEGEGWMLMGPAGKRRTKGRESVRRMLDGQVLLIEGIHESLDAPNVGTVVHHAVAMLSWDDRAQVYRFRTHTRQGYGGDFTGRMEGDAFVWTMEAPQSGRIRYTIRRDAAGRWDEVGERSTDGGTTWAQFFGMTLTPVR